MNEAQNVDLKPIYYIDFEVEKEGWNRYKLEDGASLRLKLVVINIVSEEPLENILKKREEGKEKAVNLALQSTNVVAVQVPSNLRGKPSNTPCSPREIEESVIAEDIDFETSTESFNTYRLCIPEKIDDKPLYLKMKSTPIKVSRTSKYDKYGIPFYITQTKIEAKFSEK